MNGIESIADERKRQVEEEGWAPEHDDAHTEDQMVTAAMCYLMYDPDLCEPEAPELWPWDERWWKPRNRRRDLVRAGALIAAEIDRLDRMEPK